MFLARRREQAGGFRTCEWDCFTQAGGDFNFVAWFARAGGGCCERPRRGSGGAGLTACALRKRR